MGVTQKHVKTTKCMTFVGKDGLCLIGDWLKSRELEGYEYYETVVPANNSSTDKPVVIVFVKEI